MIGYSVDSSVVMQNKKYQMLEFLTLISIDCFWKENLFELKCAAANIGVDLDTSRESLYPLAN